MNIKIILSVWGFRGSFKRISTSFRMCYLVLDRLESLRWAVEAYVGIKRALRPRDWALPETLLQPHTSEFQEVIEAALSRDGGPGLKEKESAVHRRPLLGGVFLAWPQPGQCCQQEVTSTGVWLPVPLSSYRHS